MPMMFGRAEGIELSIDTAGNPDAAARRDFAVTCREAAEKTGVNRGWNETAGRTRFYFYGEDIRAMKRNLARVLDEHPELNGVRLRRLA